VGGSKISPGYLAGTRNYCIKPVSRGIGSAYRVTISGACKPVVGIIIWRFLLCQNEPAPTNNSAQNCSNIFSYYFSIISNF
jgi:hypothetical protein